MWRQLTQKPCSKPQQGLTFPFSPSCSGVFTRILSVPPEWAHHEVVPVQPPPVAAVSAHSRQASAHRKLGPRTEEKLSSFFYPLAHNGSFQWVWAPVRACTDTIVCHWRTISVRHLLDDNRAFAARTWPLFCSESSRRGPETMTFFFLLFSPTEIPFIGLKRVAPIQSV